MAKRQKIGKSIGMWRHNSINAFDYYVTIKQFSLYLLLRGKITLFYSNIKQHSLSIVTIFNKILSG